LAKKQVKSAISPLFMRVLQNITGAAREALINEERQESSGLRIPGNGDRWFRAIMIAIPG
jgi:hypothetical protein